MCRVGEFLDWHQSYSCYISSGQIVHIKLDGFVSSELSLQQQLSEKVTNWWSKDGVRVFFGRHIKTYIKALASVKGYYGHERVSVVKE